MHSFPHWKCVRVCMCFKGPQWNPVWAPTCSFSDDNDHIITHRRTLTKKDCRVLSNRFVGTETERAERKEWNKDLALLGERDGWVFYFSLVFSSTSLLLVEHSHGDTEGRAAILVSCPAETISSRIRESKDKLLNMTQKIFITTRELVNWFV